MKNSLFRLLFKKEIDSLDETIDFEVQKRLEKIQKSLEREYKNDLKNLNTIIERILYFGYEMIGIGKNKNKELLCIAKSMDDSHITIFLFGKSYMAINNLPRIMASINENYQTKEKYIHITDIQMIDNDIGNGSVAMEYFLKTVEKTKAKYIEGELLSVDADHFDRSEHYYKKHGFDVKFNEGHNSGSIKRIL